MTEGVLLTKYICFHLYVSYLQEPGLPMRPCSAWVTIQVCVRKKSTNTFANLVVCDKRCAQHNAQQRAPQLNHS